MTTDERIKQLSGQVTDTGMLLVAIEKQLDELLIRKKKSLVEEMKELIDSGLFNEIITSMTVGRGYPEPNEDEKIQYAIEDERAEIKRIAFMLWEKATNYTPGHSLNHNIFIIVIKDAILFKQKLLELVK